MILLHLLYSNIFAAPGRLFWNTIENGAEVYLEQQEHFIWIYSTLYDQRACRRSLKKMVSKVSFS